jgi:hypothetical protein
VVVVELTEAYLGFIVEFTENSKVALEFLLRIAAQPDKKLATNPFCVFGWIASEITGTDQEGQPASSNPQVTHCYLTATPL